ncbi:MAG: Rieske 2Fe-2S domain-containing protein [Planctomycetota bacterium]|jgi:metal-sulfur cluster biosynthetic enzyme/nitrite reductase/ring-hydroxylating ferredoxin subunit|nr:Rieske 2Fe-2S domain-containing protein [Planctomycetota bacterium]MDA1200683.1 Rieske 2Fe-2S domain-containing protein [Planctomycetota bacterium]
MHEFERVIDVSEVPDPGKTLVEVEGDMIALFHVGGEWFALDDVCTHDGGPLADGALRDHTIACPRHGAKFDIRSGAALTMPAVRPTRSHEVKLEDGGVWVRLRDSATADGPAAHAASSAAGGPSSGAPSPAAAANASPASELPASAAAATTDAPPAPADTGPLSEEKVHELLKEVKDPELFVNIVDLGLIYGVTLAAAADDAAKHDVSIDMTMTSPACPAGPQLIADTKRVLTQRPDVANVEVRIVMDPPWTPDRMTESARDQLGIF